MSNKLEDAMIKLMERRRRGGHFFATKKRNKYGAIRCQIDGYNFASQKEAREYTNLKIRNMAGEIKDLVIHPSYPIVINNILVCNVILDFKYYDNLTKKYRNIDTKGFHTDLSKLKKKLVEAQYNITVEWI